MKEAMDMIKLFIMKKKKRLLARGYIFREMTSLQTLITTYPDASEETILHWKKSLDALSILYKRLK